MNIRDIRRHNMLALIKQCDTQADFAYKLGVQPNEISQIKSKTAPRNMGEELARRIEKVFKLNDGWMDNIHDHNTAAGKIRPSGTVLGSFDIWDNQTPLKHDYIEVPFLMDIELVAGEGSRASAELRGSRIRISMSTLIDKGVDPDNAVIVKISGNSMQPRFFDGDIVGVDFGKRSISDGKFYAINHDGMLRVKRLYRLPGGGIRVNSLNSDEHKDEIYTADESKSIIVLGLVFWSQSLNF